MLKKIFITNIEVIFAISVAVFASSVQAGTIPINVNCGGADSTALITMPKHLGFFNVNAGVTSKDLSGFEVIDPTNNQRFLIDGLKEFKDYTTNFDGVQTDQQSNQKVRRIKMDLDLQTAFAGTFPNPSVASQQSENAKLNGESIPSTRIIGFAKPIAHSNNTFGEQDTSTFLATSKFCNVYGISNGIHNVQVSLITLDDSANATIVSKPGIQITKDAVPVEFKGGNGSPLSIFIEGGITFKDVDLTHAMTGIESKLYLKLKPLNSSTKFPKNYFSYVSRLLDQHDSTNTLIGKSGISSMKFLPDSFLFSIGQLDRGATSGNTFSFHPSIIETVKDKGESRGDFNTDNYNDAPPVSGWYSPSLAVVNSSKSGVFAPINLDAQVTTDTYIDSSNFYPWLLMTSGDQFQDAPLNIDTFGNSRFFVVDSIDSNGRITLRKENTSSDDRSNYLDFSNIATGDKTWRGSRVRWAKRQGDGSIKIYEGYIAEHSSDGHSAILKPNDSSVTVADLPAVHQDVAFEFAKTNQ
ncbi:hypothetical protein D5018_12715 [Parashewanella curva]|uniref:Uncharacterized protein n=1 Tax=Parashewanella curva TaxID=2338552 RepID=A0A3L8PY11_9GAMM|nr:hypothetical protein [Parashewanella curva]RLV59348.1 hypothetical protein D5018_12715 [Parashewanella curva]